MRHRQWDRSRSILVFVFGILAPGLLLTSTARIAGDATVATIPLLANLELADLSTASLEGQVIYLDLDGATDVTYDGPVRITDLHVPAWDGTDGQKQVVVIEQVLTDLRRIFNGCGVVFTVEQPGAETEFSTVFIGGDDAAFREYGSFLGLAEQVDVANRDRTDTAFVFAGRIARDSVDTPTFTATLTQVIAHEVGHLLGFAHVNNTTVSYATGVLDSVAYFAGPDDGGSAANQGPVHQWLTYNAFLFYDSQFADSELADYIGDWSDFGSKHHQSNGNDNDVVEGSFDEDVSAPTTYIFDDGFHWDIVPQNPLGQDIPYYQHFVAGGDSDEIYVGWSGHASAFTQAQAYWQPYVLNNYPAHKSLAYYYLGHVAHLLEDMTVPAHVHNDEHPIRDAYEYTTGENANYVLWGYGDGMRSQPAGAIGIPESLISLFRATIDYTEEYPSDDADGDDEAAIPNTGLHRPDLVSRSGGFSGDGAYLDAASYNEITILADDLMPWAMEQVASLYRLFYSTVDTTAPEVEFVTAFGSTAETALLKPHQFDIIAFATDGVSGYDVDGFQFTVERKYGDSWVPQSIAPNTGSFEFTATSDGLYRVYVELEDAAGNEGRSVTGYFYTDSAQPLAQVYRFWSPVLGSHFYTISPSEKDYVLATWPDVWTYEGPAFYAYPADSAPAGTSAVHRFWSPLNRSHFYTNSQAEVDQVLAMYPDSVWTYEGIAFYAYAEDAAPAETSAVHRFWSEVLGGHFYTISEAEKDYVLATWPYCWTYEGIAWYAYR